MDDNKMQLFEDKRIRTAWDENKQEWFFSVVDVVAVLTDSADPTDYLKKMEEPENFDQNRKIAKRGGNVAGQARKNIEAETGKPVVTHRNAVDFAQLIGDVIEEKNDFRLSSGRKYENLDIQRKS